MKDVWKSTTTVAGEQSVMTTSTGWTRQLPVLSWDLGKSDVDDSSLNVSVPFAEIANRKMMEHEAGRTKSSHTFTLDEARVMRPCVYAHTPYIIIAVVLRFNSLVDYFGNVLSTNYKLLLLKLHDVHCTVYTQTNC